ncbi:glycosyltransferase family 4 protein [Pantanalinema sp. GBBB05]|uniref:glycosyltransferase family 4 protein n=1 Tax=Pantanalinema sp. GBBB05 TaxID=2604139 RepID=UPI001D267D14|nr:glycosyltransferase family 4 protein [Pantanalinema sp. GBBB05]
MKVTFVMASGFALTGGDRIIALYANKLKQRGHDVFVVSRPLGKPSFREQLRSLRKGKGWINVQKSKSHFDELDVPHKLIDRFRPVQDIDLPNADVVIATWWETAHWVANLSRTKGAKAYFVQHHEVFDYVQKEQAQASYLLPMHKIAVSQWLIDIMDSHYGDRDVSFVPNSIDTTLFNAQPRSKQAGPTIGMMYSKAPWKGCDVSLKAFEIAAQRIPNLQLVALSSHALVDHLPLPPNTEFCFQPPQQTLKDIYARCDAWLFGSRSEGFGLPILEAMACRTPVIGTPAGAAPELLADGAGILVNMDDPEAMANAIERIYQMSDAEWQQMSNRAYRQASSYTLEDATDRFEAALYRAIEKQKSSSL